MPHSISLLPLGKSRPPTNRQLLNRDLLAESCDDIIVDALRVHDIDTFRGDRVALLDLIRAARVVRDLVRQGVAR